jgi:hypothetical protein
MRILRGRNMNMRPQFLACIFGITVLSGCGGGGGGGDLVGVAAIVALSPIIVPTVYFVQRSSIVQPVTVVSSSGEQLTPDFTDAAEEKFTVSEETIVCNGFHSLDKPTGKVSLVCNKELKGEAIIIDQIFFHMIDIRIGPKSAPRAYNGDSRYLTEVTFRCKGLYDTTKGRVDSFLIDCGDDGKAAVSPVEGGEEPSEFKVWIHPPSQPLSEDEAARLHPRLEEPAKPLAELKARADEGDVEAQNELADYYRYGWSGVEKNIIKSYAWRTLSLQGDDPRLNRRAAGARDLTEREMTADQIAEAESLVAEWKPNPAE